MFVAVLAIFGAAVMIGAATSNVSPDKATPSAAVKPSAPVPTASIPPAPELDAVPAPAAAVKPPVTIVGCLAREDTAYKLKDTAGDNAPKARSWKTGFIKRNPAPIELYDSANHAKLPAHVGQRVSVTGELVDREMYVRSLQRVSPSCNIKS
jgi:hypothetical protein